jgi:hypothetical protein
VGSSTKQPGGVGAQLLSTHLTWRKYSSAEVGGCEGGGLLSSPSHLTGSCGFALIARRAVAPSPEADSTWLHRHRVATPVE